MKTKLFSISIKDCDVQAFKASGAGGQKRNKTSNAIRVVHALSGARGQCSEHREQSQNKQIAFRRMAETKEFKNWVKIQVAKLQGKPTVEELVDKAMEPQNLRIEIRDKNGTFIVE
jgi:protein subunit release factor B